MCGSSWQPMRSSRASMRGDYFARSDARCPHAPALNSLLPFTSFTYYYPFGSLFRSGTLSMFMGRSRPWMGCLAGPHVFVRSRVILVCARVAGPMLLACVGTLADSRAWRMWRWRAPRRRPLWSVDKGPSMLTLCGLSIKSKMLSVNQNVCSMSGLQNPPLNLFCAHCLRRPPT